MNLFAQNIESQIDNICLQLETLPLDDKVAMLNLVRSKLHEISPFREEPVDLVLWEKTEVVKGNNCNPNKVAPPEMRGLHHSIQKSGFTQPIVTHQIRSADLIDAGETDNFLVPPGIREGERMVVDGFHRHRVGKENKQVRSRIYGYLPVVQVNDESANLKDIVAAMISHNRFKGTHGVLPMANIVAELIQQGWTDCDISKELGMDADEVLRFKQNLGLPELFKDHSFSASWS